MTRLVARVISANDIPRARDDLEALLAALGLSDIRSQPWQVEYELVWAVK